MVGRTLRRPLGAILFALALAGFTLAGAATNQNDAGSGGDAPATWQAALHVSTGPTFEGNVTVGDAADVYTWSTPTHVGQPYCAQATISTPTAVDADLVVANKKAGTDSEVQDRANFANSPVHMGVVSVGADGGFVNVTPDVTTSGIDDDYHFQITTFTPNTLPSSSLSVSTTVGSGTPIPSACFGGKLDGVNHTSDTWTFSEPAGSSVSFSLADTSAAATGTVLDAAGNVLATLTSGSLVTLQMPSTGSYAFTVSSSLPTTYLSGLCDPQCGPPQQPCNPNCVLALN